MTHLTTETLIDYIHNELKPAEDARTHAHLQTCGTCRSEYERETRLSENLRRYAADALELPSMVKARIWEAVRRDSAPPYARVLAFLRPMVAVPVAAILVFALYFAGGSHRSPTGPTVDATYYFEQHAAEAIGNPLSDRSMTTSSAFETSDATDRAPVLGPATAAAAALDAVE